MSGRIGKVVASHAEGSIPCRGCTDKYRARGTQGVLPMRVGGATSQLDLPSLTPLHVAGCGRLQLGVSYWETSLALQKVVDNLPALILLLGDSWP